MRFATLNVSGPSVARADRLLEFLPSLGADVLVLTETRQNRGTTQLLDAYRDSGYAVVAAQSMDSSERGVAVIQRAGRPVPLARNLTTEARHRLVAAEVSASQSITVVGVYVPSRDASPAKIARKQRFLAQMTALARRWAHERLVFLGDLNIVSRQHVPRFTAFRCWEYDALEALERHGLVDAHALLHPGEQVHSWIGRKGTGYRYDYAFVSVGLVPHLVDCQYVHEPRELGLSDHAAVVLTLDLPVEQVSPLAGSQDETMRAAV
ncbi:MAG TPA: endonuclease/exonuclease/phosphatase family protein [Micromonosporaceae bacterium]|nr:endonuclease/exonuclease/phosphatase family protein [Micromonosporaceae bacterium]